MLQGHATNPDHSKMGRVDGRAGSLSISRRFHSLPIVASDVGPQASFWIFCFDLARSPMLLIACQVEPFFVF